MYQRLAKVDLSAGRRVEAGVVRAPDPDWAGHVVELWNGFDIGPWKEVLERLLTDDIGTEVRIYLLHRDGIPLSGMAPSPDVVRACRQFTSKKQCTAYSSKAFPFRCVWQKAGPRDRGDGPMPPSANP